MPPVLTLPARRSLSDVSLPRFSALIVGVFVCFTIISTIKTLFTETLGGDLVPLDYTVQAGQLLLATGRELLFDAAFVGVFLLCYRAAVRSRLYRPSIGENNNVVDFFFAFLSFATVLVLLFTNTGSMLRGEDNNNNRVVDLAFALFQPFYLMIIYFYSREGQTRTIHRFTFCLFVVACFLSGFTGYLLYISPFLFSAVKRKVGAMGAGLLLAFGFILLPAIRILKFLYTYHFDNLDVIFDDFGKSYLTFLEIVIDRFSYIPNVIFISDNADVLQSTMKSEYLPFFQGYVGSLIHKVIAGGQVESITTQLQYMITGFADSNATFPLISYFDVSFGLGLAVLVYAVLVNAIFMALLAMILKGPRLLFIGLVVTYTLLLGGWFWPYMNVVQAAVIYLCLHGFYKLLKYVAASASVPGANAIGKS